MGEIALIIGKDGTSVRGYANIGYTCTGFEDVDTYVWDINGIISNKSNGFLNIEVEMGVKADFAGTLTMTKKDGSKEVISTFASAYTRPAMPNYQAFQGQEIIIRAEEDWNARARNIAARKSWEMQDNLYEAIPQKVLANSGDKITAVIYNNMAEFTGISNRVESNKTVITADLINALFKEDA